MAWFATGVMVVSSVAGSVSQNKAAGKAFSASSDAVKKDYDKVINQIEEQAKSSNDAIRMEMATARFQGLANTATTSNMLVERNIAGKSAMKAYQQSNINKMMTHNVLAKKAEDNMVSFGVEMENKMAEANNAIYAGQATAMSNSVSGLSMATSAINAGMQGYAAGSSIGGAGGAGGSPELGITGKAGGVSTLGSLKQLGY